MDIEGVDVAVMYGTRGRQILMHDDLAPEYAARSRAPTTTGRRITAEAPDRLKFAAQVAMHSIPAADRRGAPVRSRAGAVAIIARRTRSTASTFTTRRAIRSGARWKS